MTFKELRAAIKNLEEYDQDQEVIISFITNDNYINRGSIKGLLTEATEIEIVVQQDEEE